MTKKRLATFGPITPQSSLISGPFSDQEPGWILKYGALQFPADISDASTQGQQKMIYLSCSGISSHEHKL